jgi:ribonuclease HII
LTKFASKIKKKPMPVRRLYLTDGLIEAGCDEAGRGCLAGPVVAAAVILPVDFKPEWVDDSKQLLPEAREESALIILERAICWAVAEVDHLEIDRINILKASFLAMHKALDKLSVIPQLIVVDGNRFNRYKNIPHACVVEGDAKIASVAAASILAKTHRDKLMRKLHEKHPEYGWYENKGYSTPLHLKAIKEVGVSPYHRRTYRPVYMHLNSGLFGNGIEEDTTLIEQDSKFAS